MKFKLAFFALICAVSVFLTGCGGSRTVYKNGAADIIDANITISFPENWAVATDDDAYDDICSTIDLDGVSAKSLKAMYKSVGAQILLSAHSPGDDVTVMFSRAEKGERSAEEILQGLHDNAVFEYRSSDFVTESSFGEYEQGGVSGFLSVIKVFYGIGEPEFTTEKRQFYFERGGSVFSLVVDITGGSEQEAEGIVISAKE